MPVIKLIGYFDTNKLFWAIEKVNRVFVKERSLSFQRKLEFIIDFILRLAMFTIHYFW